MFRFSVLILTFALLVSCIQPVTMQTAHGSWAAPQLGVVVDEQMTVIDVDPNSAAELAGVKRGDVLVAIEGVSFATAKAQAEQIIWAMPPEGEEAYQRFASGGEWKNTARQLLLQRDGQQLTLSIVPKPPSWDPKAPPTAMPVEKPLDYL